MRVAVLGASGLIGSAMAEQLRTRGHEVVSVGRGGQGVQWDLCSGRPLPGQALEGCGALIHAAGVTDEDFADRSMA